MGKFGNIMMSNDILPGDIKISGYGDLVREAR